jgi:hypothetical protein
MMARNLFGGILHGRGPSERIQISPTKTAKQPNASGRHGETQTCPETRRSTKGVLMYTDRVLDGLLAEPEIATDEDEGRGDAEPHAEESKEGAEGNGARALLAPDEEI